MCSSDLSQPLAERIEKHSGIPRVGLFMMNGETKVEGQKNVLAKVSRAKD